MTEVAPNVPAGWYDDGTGRRRWWDGSAWQMYEPEPQAPPQAAYVGRKANQMPVSYTRSQKGHSLTLWIVLSVLLGIPVIWLIYFSASPNHYWHA